MIGANKKMSKTKQNTLAVTLCMLVTGVMVSSAQAQQRMCSFEWNAGTMVLNTNKTGYWTGGSAAGQFAGQRGNNTWRVDGDVIHTDWVIVTEGHMKGRVGFTRPPLSSCPAAARR